MSNKVYPCIWCNANGQQAAAFYCRAFANTHIVHDVGVVIALESSGQKFILNEKLILAFSDF